MLGALDTYRQFRNFNTKKVRLKRAEGPAIFTALRIKFQYQKGAIKTIEHLNSFESPEVFQYQKGAIKTSLLRAVSCSRRVISIPKRCD